MSEKKEEANKISRRRYLKYGAAAVVVVAAGAGGAYYYSTIPPPTPAPTATVTQLATSVSTVTQSAGMNAIADVATNAAGNQYSGVTLRALGESPFWPSLIGKVSPIWTGATGMTVSVDGVPTYTMRDKALNEIVAHTGYYDIIGAWYYALIDLVEAGGIEPLDPYIEKYYPTLFTDGPPYGFEPMVNTKWPGANALKYNGSTYAIVSDGDPWIFYYRTDLYGDPGEQDAFKSKYGYPLAVPQDFDQWRDQLEFWRRKPGDNLAGKKLTADFYGGSYMEARNFARTMFEVFFYSYGGIPFDPATMAPLINGPEGVKALNRMMELNSLLPSDVSTYDYTAANNLFSGGNAASYISWGISGKILNAQAYVSPAVYGNVGYAPVPGSKDYTTRAVSGMTQTPVTINQRGKDPIGPGVTCLSSDSKNKDAAFLFMLWITSPSISMTTIFDPMGSWDPNRYVHFVSSAAQSNFKNASQYLQAQWNAQTYVSPDIAILQGAVYEDKLDIQVLSAITKTKSVQDALNQVATDWATITASIGADKQKAIYQLMYPLYVSPVPDQLRIAFPSS